MKKYISLQCNFDRNWFYVHHGVHDTEEAARAYGEWFLGQLQSEEPSNELMSGCTIVVKELDLEDDRDYECPNEIPDGYAEP